MKHRNVIIGLFVIAGVALFTLGIFLIGNQNKAFAKHTEFYTEFTNLDGLIKGAKVRVEGFDAGEVTDIGVPDSPSSKFRLKLRIVDRVRGLVRSDSLVTISTEGVVGDKYVLIHAGAANAPEAGPGATLPSKEPLNMTDLLEKSAGLLNNANGTMKTVAEKLNGTLDAVKTTVNNTNDVVVGIKHGKGTVGMLLRDEKTASTIRQTVSNVQQASASVNDASKQADAMVTDLRSRNFGEKADQTMSSVQDAVHNFDASSQELHQTITTALGTDANGVDAGSNIRQSLSNLNVATGNMAEDTEALKHEFFFRGFFKHRGYYSLAELNPDQYRSDQIFTQPGNGRIWLDAVQLFEKKPDGSETLSPAGKTRIDAAIARLGDQAVGQPLIIEGYATEGDAGAQLAVSRTRAILVRDYLHKRFQIDMQNVGTVALRGIPSPATHKATWDGVSVVSLRTPKKAK